MAPESAASGESADLAEPAGSADDAARDEHVVVASAPAVSEQERDDGHDLVDLPEPSSSALRFWESVGIDPVLISLPGGAGLTLRGYLEVAAEEADEEDPTTDDADVDDADDADDAADEIAEDAVPIDPIDGSPVVSDDEVAASGPVIRRSGIIEGETTTLEPRFLGEDEDIFLFSTVEALVAYVRSDADHPLTEAPGWSKVRKASTLDPTPELLNRYELDLVVDIARAGADGWGEEEKQTLLLAGEIARDAAAYCGLADVQAMLGPGSPLDALDDDLRKGGFLAKRRLRKYNPDQIALSWRRIIRELGTAVEYR